MDHGKLLRKKGSSSYLFPAAVMSFWAVLSNCFSITVPERPIATVLANNFKISALFDTGSSFTLVNSKLKSKIIASNAQPIPGNQIKLCAANGQILNSKGTYTVDIQFANHSFKTAVQFIDNLQLPCIIGMDFMSKANINICAQSKKIKIGHPSRASSIPIISSKRINLPAFSETLVPLKVNGSYSSALIEGSSSLPEGICVMEGIVSVEDRQCNAVFANFTHLPVSVPAYSSVAKLHIGPLTAMPLASCLASQPAKPVVRSVDHLERIDLSHIPVSYQARYRSLLNKYGDVFSKSDLDIGHCTSLPHVVRLKDPNRITSITQYRLPYKLKEVAIDYVQKLMEAGVIRKSTSVFNSPLMLVKKPNADPKKPLGEQYRLVHNYVDLNKNINPCSYPLRHLYELLDEVASGKVFSVLDLSQGFFQQALVDPQESTSFSIPGIGQYTYCRSPQGLNSSPAYFQRLLDFVLGNIPRVYVYIDDVVVSVATHEENLAKLSSVFQRFRQHNLKIKPSKCHIGTGRITYLGYDICKDKGIRPGDAKTLVIKNWPIPASVRDVRAFIGLTSFFRRAIKDFSLISGPLNKLIRKDSGYTKGPLPEAAKQSFLALQHAMISKPCLSPVNFNCEFIVTCDASETHFGTCLSQKGTDGIERPCAYASKLLSEKESKQSPGTRERAALIYALRHWKPYLIGREFVLRTDHKPNVAIADSKSKIYDTLSDEIMQFQPFRMEYLRGDRMFADALSRPPAINCISLPDIALAQRSDPYLKSLRAGRPCPDNLLFYNKAYFHTDGTLFVPTSVRKLVLQACHDKAGHFGPELTIKTVRNSFYWPGLYSDTTNYVTSCDICQSANPARPRTRLPLASLQPKAVAFGDRFHLDLVDMPKSASGHVAICTIVDAATGFVIVHPCLDKTHHGVIEALRTKVFPNFGCPQVLVTDKGKENVNHEVNLFLDNHRIKHVKSSTGHPQSNGMVERRQQMICLLYTSPSPRDLSTSRMPSSA